MVLAAEARQKQKWEKEMPRFFGWFVAVCGLLLATQAVSTSASWAKSCVDTVTDAARCGTETVANGATCGWDNVTDGAKCGTETITDGAKCGTETVTDAGKCGTETVTDAAKCGTKNVTDGTKCGTETVTDGAKCGWDTFSDIGKCGSQCLSSGFKKCSCKFARKCKVAKSCDVANSCQVAKSCKAAKSCQVAKSCKAAKSCQVAKSCNVVSAGCALFPQDWKAQVLANISATPAVRDLLTKQAALAQEQAPKMNALTSTVGKTLLMGLRNVAAQHKQKREAWQSKFETLAKDSAKLEVVQKVILKVSKGQIDNELKGYVKQLDGWLVGDGKTRFAQASTFDSAVKYAGDALGVRSAHAASYGDELTFSVVVNINGGTVIGGGFAIGVAWDRQGVVKGVIMAGLLVGFIIDAGLDLTYRIHPTNMSGVSGPGMGIGASAAYGVGANACVEWTAPYVNPVPTWGYGVSVGTPGGQVSWSYGPTVTFPG
jgi:hypothetical protein